MNEINSSKNSTFPTHAGKAYETNTKNSSAKEKLEQDQGRSVPQNENARVTISDAVKDYSEIKHAADLARIPDKSAKILELKKKIEEGSYNIDFDDLASKVLEKEFGKYEES